MSSEAKNIKSFFRPLFYIVLLIICVVAVQLKKADVIEDRTREVVSIPKEIDTHGWPVDVEKLGAVDLKDTLRFTLQSSGKNGRASFFVSRSQVAKVKAGQTVLDSDNSEVIGEIASVATRANLTNGLYEAWVSLNKKGQKEVEAFTSANVVIRTLKDRLSVPVEAIDFDRGIPYVWVSEKDQARRVEVKLGSLTSGRYEVLSGLSRNDLIVVSGQKALEAGVKLRVRDCRGCSQQKEEVKS